MLRLPVYDQMEDVTIHQDSDQEHVFYLIPNEPTLRFGRDGRPIFQFLKYKEAVPLPSGDQGGGYVQFDTEFVVPDTVRKRIIDQLQERIDKLFRDRGRPPPTVQVGVPQWVDGKVELITFQPKEGGFIKNIIGAGKPSLLGSNIASFAMELSQRGATLLWEAFQMATLPIAVHYSLKFWARMPAIEMRVWFHSHQLETFWEQIEKDESIWSDDTMVHRRRETFSKNSVGDVQIIDYPMRDAEGEKFKKQVIEWGWGLLEDQVKAMLTEVRNELTGPGERGDNDDFDKITRNFVRSHTSDFDLYFKRESVVEWPIEPGATMQGFLGVPGPNGQKPRKEDFFKEISLDDPFFHTMRINVRCNADFEKDPIHSVQVTVTYGTKVESFLFTNNTTMETMRVFVEPNLGRKYRYRAKVNYKQQSRTFEIPETTTDDTELVLSFGRLGYLQVNMTAGDFDWSVITMAEVQIRYADPAHGVPMETATFVLNENQKTAEYSRVLFALVEKPYEYKVTYFLKSGQQVERPFTAATTPQLVIHDVFEERLIVNLQSVGSFDRMQRVTVDCQYEDPANNYRVAKSFLLSSESPTTVWTVPLFSQGPTKFRYRCTTLFKDGHIEEHDFQTKDGSTTLLLGEVFQATLAVTLNTDLLNFNQLKLVKATLKYSDPVNQIEETDDFVFTKDKSAAQTWQVPIKDRLKTGYIYSALYVLSDGSRRTEGPKTQADETVLLEVPAGGGQ